MERTNANGGKKGPTQWPRAPAGGQAGRRRAREAKRYFRTHFKRWKRAIRDPDRRRTSESPLDRNGRPNFDVGVTQATTL